MKKMNKILAILLALTTMFALAACGGNNGNSGGNSAPKTTTVSGDMVTVELPSGWSLVTGTDMFGTDTADVICHTEDYQTGDPYLQVEEYSPGSGRCKGGSGIRQSLWNLRGGKRADQRYMVPG